MNDKRWVVLGFEHPALGTYEIARFRTKLMARLSAFLFRHVKGSLLWPDAWVVDGHRPARSGHANDL